MEQIEEGQGDFHGLVPRVKVHIDLEIDQLGGDRGLIDEDFDLDDPAIHVGERIGVVDSILADHVADRLDFARQLARCPPLLVIKAAVWPSKILLMSVS